MPAKSPVKPLELFFVSDRGEKISVAARSEAEAAKALSQSYNSWVIYGDLARKCR